MHPSDLHYVTENLKDIEPKLSKVESGRIALGIINDLLSEIGMLEEKVATLQLKVNDNEATKTLDKIRDLIGGFSGPIG